MLTASGSASPSWHLRIEAGSLLYRHHHHPDHYPTVVIKSTITSTVPTTPLLSDLDTFTVLSFFNAVGRVQLSTFSQIKLRRFREVKSPAQDYIASKWQRRGLKPQSPCTLYCFLPSRMPQGLAQRYPAASPSSLPFA